MEKLINNYYVVALDAGKYETKLIGRNVNGGVDDIKRINFRTKYYDLDMGYTDVQGNSHKVKLDDKEYIVGEQGTIDGTTETSKMTLLHKLAAYTAITQILDGNQNNKINLVLACPLSIVRNSNAKENFKNFIKGDGTIKIEVDDVKYEFEIEDITIKTEGTGILFLEQENFRNKTVGVIDIGGLNRVFSLFRNCVVNPNERFIDNFGSTELVFRVSDALTDLNDGNIISFEQSERALDNGYMTKDNEIDAESSKVIKNVKLNFIDDSIEAIEKRGFKLDQLEELYFIGGTTQKVKEQVILRYSKANIPGNSQWTNVEGFYKIAVAKYCK